MILLRHQVGLQLAAGRVSHRKRGPPTQNVFVPSLETDLETDLETKTRTPAAARKAARPLQHSPDIPLLCLPHDALCT